MISKWETVGGEQNLHVLDVGLNVLSLNSGHQGRIDTAQAFNQQTTAKKNLKNPTFN